MRGAMEPAFHSVLISILPLKFPSDISWLHFMGPGWNFWLSIWLAYDCGFFFCLSQALYRLMCILSKVRGWASGMVESSGPASLPHYIPESIFQSFYDTQYQCCLIIGWGSKYDTGPLQFLKQKQVPPLTQIRQTAVRVQNSLPGALRTASPSWLFGKGSKHFYFVKCLSNGCLGCISVCLQCLNMMLIAIPRPRFLFLYQPSLIVY